MRNYANRPVGTVPRARQLRREASEPERRLWRALREAFPALRFRRQVPLGPYFVDFCSHAARLVIEVDGDTHAGAEAYDAARTRYLESEGYRVRRFANTDVMRNPDGVIASISFSLREKEGARAAQPRGKDEGSAIRTRVSTA